LKGYENRRNVFEPCKQTKDKLKAEQREDLEKVKKAVDPNKEKC
jgi:hypothetical protein